MEVSVLWSSKYDLARRVRMKRFDWSRASPYFRLWTAICKHWRATFFPLRPTSSRGPKNLVSTMNVSNIDFRLLMILNCYSLCQSRFYAWHTVYIAATEIGAGNVTWVNPMNRSKQMFLLLLLDLKYVKYVRDPRMTAVIVQQRVRYTRSYVYADA